MSSQGGFPKWGQLPTKHHEQVTTLQLHTKEALCKLHTGQIPPDNYLINVLETLGSFLRSSLEQPSPKLILEAVTHLAEDSKMRDRVIQEKIKGIGSSTISSTPSSTRSWASVAGGVPLSSNTRSAGGVIIPQAKTEIQERQIVVKMNNPATSQENKKATPSQIAQRINKALTEKGVTEIQVAAAQAMPNSGDIMVTAANTAEAEKIRLNEQWTKTLSQTASLRVRTYGIFVRGVRTEDLAVTDMEVAKKIIKERNQHTLNLDIHWVGYLHRIKEGEITVPLIIELKNEEQADIAIRKGISIGDAWYECKVYNRNARSCQCFKCWQYGHLSTSCFNIERCGNCSGEHVHTFCPKGNTTCCVMCKGLHTAWSKSCPRKKKDMERIKIAKQNTPHYHGTSQLFSHQNGTRAPNSSTSTTSTITNDQDAFFTPYPGHRPSSDRPGPSFRGRGRGGNRLRGRGGLNTSRDVILQPSSQSSTGSPTKVTRAGASTRSMSPEKRVSLTQLSPNTVGSGQVTSTPDGKKRKKSGATQGELYDGEVMDMDVNKENQFGALTQEEC